MAVGTNLASVLGGRVLCGTIEKIKPGLPVESLPPGLMTPNRKINGNNCTYYQVNGSRQTARMVQYGAASQRRTISGVSEVPVILSHWAENMEIKPATLMNLQSQTGEEQERGEQEVTRQLKETKQISENTRAAYVMAAFALGQIYFGLDGSLSATTVSGGQSIDMKIPAANATQGLDTDGSTALVSASWLTAGTNIVGDVVRIQKRALQQSGYKLKNALYGSAVINAMLANTSLQNIIYRSPEYQKAFSQGMIPNGFLGLNWYPAYETFFEDNTDTAGAGAIKELFPTGQVTFLPEVSADWYELIEGSKLIPSGVGASADISQLIGSAMNAYGEFAYAYATMDPFTCTMVYGDTFLPVIKVPSAVYKLGVIYT